MQLNTKLLQLLGLRFADDSYDIDFDDYLTCIVRLENMFSKYTFPVLSVFTHSSTLMYVFIIVYARLDLKAGWYHIWSNRQIAGWT